MKLLACTFYWRRWSTEAGHGWQQFSRREFTFSLGKALTTVSCSLQFQPGGSRSAACQECWCSPACHRPRCLERKGSKLSALVKTHDAGRICCSIHHDSMLLTNVSNSFLQSMLCSPASWHHIDTLAGHVPGNLLCRSELRPKSPTSLAEACVNPPSVQPVEAWEHSLGK